MRVGAVLVCSRMRGMDAEGVGGGWSSEDAMRGAARDCAMRDCDGSGGGIADLEATGCSRLSL